MMIFIIILYNKIKTYNYKWGEILKKYDIPELKDEIAWYDIFEHREVNVIKTIPIRRNTKQTNEVLLTWNKKDINILLYIIEGDLDIEKSII